MTENGPFLFVHLPHNEIRGDRLLDATPNRRHAIPHHANVGADDTLGACLELSGATDSFVECPPWKLYPEALLPAASTRPPSGEPQKLTFTIWISPAAGDGEWALIDWGLSPDAQRLKVGFKRTNHKLSFTALAPAELERTRGYRWTADASAQAGPWMHFALVFDPKGYGDCQMYLNGGFFSSYGKTIGEAPPRFTRAASYPNFLGWRAFRGRLAHFRIYTRELTKQEIVQEIDRDSERLRIASPLDCSLIDPLKRPMMYLDASDIGEKMQVVVKPLRNGMTLAGLPTGPPAPGKCHFELAFRPGTLDLSGNPDISANTRDGRDMWEAKAFPRTSRDGHDSVCIRCNFARPLTGEVDVVLNALKADRRFAPRWTLVDIRFGNLKDGEGQLLSGRIPQWLQLAPRVPRTSLSMSGRPLRPEWTQDPTDKGSGPLVREGKIFLLGHFICAAAQELMKKDNWQILKTIDAEYTPFGNAEMRFPGRVRWQSAAGPAGPKTLWCSDVIVAPNGVVSIDAGLPREILREAGRVDVFLDGISYSNEKLWVVK